MADLPEKKAAYEDLRHGVLTEDNSRFDHKVFIPE